MRHASRVVLQLELGNDAMITGPHIASALREAADRIEKIHNPRPVHSFTLRDENGNKVGTVNVEE